MTLLSQGVVVIVSLLSFMAHAEVDPYNTYQWDGKTNQWFEWWYYKVLDPQTHHSFYFCYGVVNPSTTESVSPHARAFVSFGDFQQNLILQTEVPLETFRASTTTPFIQVGPHIATDQALSASFLDSGHHVQWLLSIKKKMGWNAMGWGLSERGLFNIYWHPAQMDASFQGILDIDGKHYIFKDADGYQDHNWGASFPKWWFWIASNAFQENSESSFVGGGGHAQTPLGFPLPTAILLGLHHEGQLYAFRSSEPEYIFDWDMKLGQWDISAFNTSYKLKLHAQADPSQMMDLPFLTPEGKTFHDYETLNGNLHIELYKRKFLSTSWEKIANLSTPNSAGLELGLEEKVPATFELKK
ncbi:MAG: hypothetical protein HYY61_00360 [Deltaproteobacteria bacterium]|nr:hypothetical protein [Deltaproteobacteria bacterium]